MHANNNLIQYNPGNRLTVLHIVKLQPDSNENCKRCQLVCDVTISWQWHPGCHVTNQQPWQTEL